MATTTNFGWTTPNDTDLVKDGAAAIRTLGSNIDTSLVDLKGGTTGQVLAKASGTDLDFTWATDASGIPATIFDAKGDIIAATAADTASRLAVGANNTVLTADSSAATGLKWAVPSAGPTGFTLLNTGGTAMTGAATITVSGISAKQILVFLLDVTNTATNPQIFVRPNNLTTAVYNNFGIRNTIKASYVQTDRNYVAQFADSNGIPLAAAGGPGNGTGGFVFIDLCDTTGTKRYQSSGSGQGGSADFRQAVAGGTIAVGAAITSIAVNCSSGTFNGGTLYVYGAN